MRFVIPSLTALALAAATPVQAERIFGLVIGVDDYEHITKLDGAVNDARDISDALIGMDATVVTLLDGQATRDAILSNWQRLAQQLQPGDKLVVSYAGHGSNEPEHWPGNEEDGRDETFLLAGFSPYGDAAGERIRDDEIADLLKLTPDNEVIFVADACHSGTISRNINPVLGYRYVSHDRIGSDPLPPPPPPPPNGASNDEQADTALFLAAVSESDKVPEFLIDGKPRGALSYAFAQALRGEADLNQDSRMTKGEIETYVRRQVRGISQGSQKPQTQHAGSADEVLFASNAPIEIAVTPPVSIFDLGFEGFPAVSLASSGQSDFQFSELSGVELVTNGGPAEISVDFEGKQIRSMVGDVISEIGEITDAAFQPKIQAVIDKARLATVLQKLAATSRMDLKFSGGDRTYKKDEIMSVQLSGRETTHLTLFNIGSDGQISYLYPIQRPSDGINDPLEIDSNSSLDIPLMIAPPFGADHVVAIETVSDPAILRRVLLSYDGSKDLRGFWEQFRLAAKSLDQSPEFAVFPFHTAAN